MAPTPLNCNQGRLPQIFRLSEKGDCHMKKACLIIGILALIGVITGIPDLVAGLRQRGMDGVNYGRILFPLVICAVSLGKYAACKR